MNYSYSFTRVGDTLFLMHKDVPNAVSKPRMMTNPAWIRLDGNATIPTSDLPMVCAALISSFESVENLSVRVT